MACQPGNEMWTKDLKGQKNVTFASLFYTVRRIRCQRWHVQLVRKNFIQHVCISGFPQVRILLVPCVEIYFDEINITRSTTIFFRNIMFSLNDLCSVRVLNILKQVIKTSLKQALDNKVIYIYNMQQNLLKQIVFLRFVLHLFCPPKYTKNSKSKTKKSLNFSFNNSQSYNFLFTEFQIVVLY